MREGEDDDADVEDADVDEELVAEASEAVADEITLTAELMPSMKLPSGFVVVLCASAVLAPKTVNAAERMWLRNIVVS